MTFSMTELKRLSLLSASVMVLAVAAGCAASSASGQSSKVDIWRAGQMDDPSRIIMPRADYQPSDAERRNAAYLSLRHAEMQDDWLTAFPYAVKALEGDPENEALRRRVFLFALASQDLQTAASVADTMDSDAGRDLLQLAPITRLAAHVENGELDEALVAIDKANPGKGDAAQYILPLLEAWIEFERQDSPDKALKMADKLVEETRFEDGRNDTLFTYHAALMHEAAGKLDKAEDWYKAAEETGSSYRILRSHASLLMRQGRNAEALALYKDAAANLGPAVELGPEMAAIARGEIPAGVIDNARKGVAETLFDVGTVLQSRNTRELALIFGQMTLALTEDHDFARLLVGDTLIDRGQSQQAIKFFNDIGESSPLGWRARLRLSDALFNEDKLADAEKLLTEMVRQQPQRYGAVHRLARIKSEQGDDHAAIKLYSDLLSQLDDPGVDYWQAYYARAIAYEETDQWKKAEADLLKALELQPNQPYVLNYLGYSWADRNERLDEALDMIERAVAQRPNDGYLVDSLGWVLYRMGEYDKALPVLEKAARLQPADAAILDHLGDIYHQQGRNREARFMWVRALGYSDDQTLRGRIQKKLDGANPLKVEGLLK